MNGKPLYQVIYDTIYDAISNGAYPSGKLPSDGQLLRRFGTTRATVAKAMNALEHAGLIIRKPGAGTFVRPTGNAHGLFVSTLIAGLGDTEFFEPICAQIAQSCHACNLNLLWGPDSQTHDLGRDVSVAGLLEHFKRQNISGVFFAPDEDIEGGASRNLEVAGAFTAAGIAVVLLDRDIVPFPQQGPYDLVGIDNVAAGFRQTQYLIGRGARRIVYVTRPGRLWTMSARVEGFRAALEEAGLPFTPKSVCTGNAADMAFCKKVMSLRPDGIVCFHDPIAAALLRNLQALRIDVPGKVQVIGLDDARYAQYLTIPLTTLRQPCRSIGDQAASLMAMRLTHDRHPPRRILFDTQLIVRDSTR